MAAEEQATMVVFLTCGYRAKCLAPGCGNVARAIVRYTDSGGRPLGQGERCGAHTTEAMAVALDADLKIHDDRKS
jgi:hypothetical protein